MNFPRRSGTYAISILLAMAALAARSSAEAGFIDGDLGPGDSYNASSGYTLSGPNSYTGLGYSLAVRFQVSGTSSVAFGSAELALRYFAGANSVDVLLLGDSGGVPGATLETMHASNISTAPSPLTVTSTANTLLMPGTDYWLAAVTSGDTYMSWMANNQGRMDHLAYRTDHGTGPTPWSLAEGNPDVAFAIYSASVATPPSAAMLGVGLVVLGGYGIGRTYRAR